MNSLIKPLMSNQKSSGEYFFWKHTAYVFVMDTAMNNSRYLRDSRLSLLLVWFLSVIRITTRRIAYVHSRSVVKPIFAWIDEIKISP